MKLIEKPKKIYEPEVGDYIIIKEFIPANTVSHAGTDTIGGDIILLDVIAKVISVEELFDAFTHKNIPGITVEYKTRACNGDYMTVRRKLSITNDGNMHNGVCTYYYPFDDERPAITEFGFENTRTLDEKLNEIENNN